MREFIYRGDALCQQEAGGRGQGAGGRTPYLKAGASNKDVLYLVAIELGTN